MIRTARGRHLLCGAAGQDRRDAATDPSRRLKGFRPIEVRHRHVEQDQADPQGGLRGAGRRPVSTIRLTVRGMEIPWGPRDVPVTVPPPSSPL